MSLFNRQTKNNSKRVEQPDYEKLGRLLFAVGQSGVSDRKKLYRIAFWKGVWSGLGGVIGATIVVSLLLWLFTILDNIWFLGDFIHLVREQIAQK